MSESSLIFRRLDNLEPSENQASLRVDYNLFGLFSP